MEHRKAIAFGRVKGIDVREDGNPVVAWSDEWVLLFAH